MRSKSSGDPKISPQTVAIYTAESGSDGAALRRKYTQGIHIKSTRQKANGNSGQCGRAWRRKQRMHGGGQISAEEKSRRAAQSAEFVNARTEWLP